MKKNKFSPLKGKYIAFCIGSLIGGLLLTPFYYDQLYSIIAYTLIIPNINIILYIIFTKTYEKITKKSQVTCECCGDIYSLELEKIQSFAILFLQNGKKKDTGNRMYICNECYENLSVYIQNEKNERMKF